MDASIALVAIAPFVAALLAPLAQRLTRPFAGWVLAAVPLAIFAFLLTLVEPVIANGAVSASIGWVPAYDLNLSFFVDGLSLTFALTISGIGALIVLYSGAYLKGHPHLGRFLGFLLAFMGAMLGLVLADNMLALFMFWELTSVTSFLLIGFDHTRQASRRGAIQALVITNIGGMGLLVGALLVHHLTGTWELSALGALRQTDLKQMLAQTTIASLGLSVLLIGLGTEAAIAAMALYFVAHALYKAGLFMVVGAIDHEAGTRDITVLGGL
ncbi:MAG: proton-conducting transporter membrane subunit, partial [Devosia sp.]